MAQPTQLDTKPLIGATIQIDGRVRIEHPDLAWTNVQRGQEVHLMLRYRINEANVEREHYRFRVDSSVGGMEPEGQEREHKDTLGTHDVWLGTLGHRYRFDSPGSYEGIFKATVEYGTVGWLSGKRIAHKSETIEVPVRIDVV